MCKYDLKETSWNKLFIVIVSSRDQLQYSNVYCLTDFKIMIDHKNKRIKISWPWLCQFHLSSEHFRECRKGKVVIDYNANN